ncbi:MAG: SMP-30/gluconolactonase/LRE family protein [Rhodospirillales bacterium]
MNRTGRRFESATTPADIRVVVRARNILGESPVWCARTERLLFADIVRQLIHVVNPADGHCRSFQLPEMGTSVSPRQKGGWVLTLRKTFALFDPETGALDILADPEPDRPDNRFNDGKCDRQGRLWAGTMGAKDWRADSGALYRLDGDRRITRMQDRVKCSNGTGWSPDGRTMYYTESFRYTIYAYDFDPASGELANRRPFAALDPDAGGFPDGLTVDAEGFVWSAQPVYGRLVRYDPTGGIERIVALPVSRGTSCAFGGPDYGTLFVTTATETLTPEQMEEEPLAGSLLAFEPGVCGLAETPFAG